MAGNPFTEKRVVPPCFMPYLEKHRIYELFHELGNELAMAQPKDPLTHLRACLTRKARSRDQRVVLLMAPPYLDRVRLAHLLSKKTECKILSRYLVCMKPGDYYDPDALAINTANIIKTSNKDGWILADFPDTEEEARILIQNGVLPTHAFLLLNDEHSNTDKEQEKENLNCIDTTPSILFEFENSIFRLKELFKSSLKVVKMKSKSLEEIASSCARALMTMPPRHAPKVFRLALIGPRGSRRRTIATILANQYRLVHVDMHHLINAAKIMKNDLGDNIRFLDQNGCPLPVKIVFDLLKRRVHQQDCLDRGYVLTNFPCSLADFVLLDSIDTPPNRVIFFDIDTSECQARLEDRVVNMYTGDLYSKRSIQENNVLQSQSLTHPDDLPRKVAEEIRFYNERVKDMIDYCGKTCSMVDATGPLKALLERVEAVLMRPSLPAKPRTGKMPVRYSVADQVAPMEGPLQSMPYPVSRTEVTPLIDSEELLRRFKELKATSSHVHFYESKTYEKSKETIDEYTIDGHTRKSTGESGDVASNSLGYTDLSQDNGYLWRKNTPNTISQTDLSSAHVIEGGNNSETHELLYDYYIVH